MKIHKISLPTPFPVGDVNVYLIDDDPLTLIDTGPKTPAALTALETGLRQHKFGLADIKRILLTHAHEDHCGLAKTIRDAAPNVEMRVHDWETGFTFGNASRREDAELFERAGVPFEAWQSLAEFYDKFDQVTDHIPKSEFEFLRDNMEIEFAGGALRVWHTPGHSPGSCSFLREADRTVIAGDLVIKHITPNPILAIDPLDKTKRFASLGEYLVSLARVKDFAPTIIYSGHGDSITDFGEVFNRYVRNINDRQNKVLDLIGSNSATAWQIAQKLFPTAINQIVHRFLAISEAVAHLDYAAAEGKLAVELKDKTEMYRKR